MTNSTFTSSVSSGIKVIRPIFESRGQVLFKPCRYSLSAHFSSLAFSLFLSSRYDRKSMKMRPIGHFAGYNMPAAPINTRAAGISTFWKAKFTFESAQ